MPPQKRRPEDRLRAPRPDVVPLLLLLLVLGLVASAPAAALPRIQGYATSAGVVQGGTLELHVWAFASSYSILIEDALEPAPVLARFDSLPGYTSAIPESSFAWGCGWPVSLAVPVPAAWPSGVYYARLVAGPLPDEHRQSGAYASADSDTTFVPFVVMEDEPGSTSPILFQLSTNTYNAYNAWGGRSLYPQNSQQNYRSYFVSTQRPYDDERGKGQFPWWERPFAAWLRTEGIPVEFCTNLELHRNPGLLAPYRLFLSVGHDEYWSKEMYDQAEAFREAGGNLAFFSGNSIFWCVRFEGETMICYKDHLLDPYYALGYHDQVTVNWRNWPLQRPEGRLIGVQFDDWCWRPCGVPLTVREPGHWALRDRDLTPAIPLGTNVVGYEWDQVSENAQPPNVQIVAETSIQNHAGEPSAQQSSYYEHPPVDPRSRIFAAGTIQWSWGVRPDTAGADPHLLAITRRIVRCLSQPSLTESAREVIFSADLRQANLPPEITVYLRGSPPPLGPDSTDHPMLDDGVPPDAQAGDRIHTRAVVFPAGSWDIVHYRYWTASGPCSDAILSAWIEDPELGPGPTVELSQDRPESCPYSTPNAVAESQAPMRNELSVAVRAMGSALRIEVELPFVAGEPSSKVPLRVAIYDVSGRLVRLVASGPFSGRATFRWEGEDDAGRPVPAGIYLIRVRAGEREKAVKVVW